MRVAEYRAFRWAGEMLHDAGAVARERAAVVCLES
jgi:hypothetical protein